MKTPARGYSLENRSLLSILPAKQAWGKKASGFL